MDTKTVPLQAWKEGLQEFEGPKNSRQSAHEGGKIVTALRTGRLYPLAHPWDTPSIHFC